MAQSIDDILKTTQNFKEELPAIYQVINDEIQADVQIDASSVSKVAQFRLWEYVNAAMSWLQQILWDAFKVELTKIADEAPTCNKLWFTDQSLLFQYGDPLLFDSTTRKPYYDPITPANQIIKRVAVSDNNSSGVIKVAKEIAEVPSALSAAERDAFEAYIRRIQPIGSNISILSQAADTIASPMTIVYDPIIPLDTIKANVEAAVNAYLSTIEFNGIFYTIKLVDEIQKVEGIIDVIPGQFQSAQDGDPLADFSRTYEPISGYLAIDAGSPLATVIQYSAQE